MLRLKEGIWTGIAASEGVGIGPAFLLEAEAPEVTGLHFSGAETERAKLSQALMEFEAETAALAERLRETAGQRESQILLGQVTMTRDPYLQAQLQEEIDGGSPAAMALDTVCRRFAALLRSGGDPYMAQRSADVEDLRVRLLRRLMGGVGPSYPLPDHCVLAARELTPSMTAGLDPARVSAILTEDGGATSHAAILARALGIPAVLGLSGLTRRVSDGMQLAVDGTTGRVIPDPSPEELAEFTVRQAQWLREKESLRVYLGRQTVTADGHPVRLYANIGSPEEAAAALAQDAEGIGLFRTEYLFLDRYAPPSEEEQLAAYRMTLRNAAGRVVTLRTLDIGGDKPLAYQDPLREDNPALGLRGLRYCLTHRALFRAQLRAALRASAYGTLRLLLPMVSVPEEVRQVRLLLAEVREELRREGHPFREDIPLGVTLETPAASRTADLFAAEADFFSIGTNDLIGYTMAADRDNARVAGLHDICQPAVLRSIQACAQAAKEAGAPLSMCGEAAGDPRLAPLWLAFGVGELSVSPARLLAVRKALAGITLEQARQTAGDVMRLNSAEMIRKRLKM